MDYNDKNVAMYKILPPVAGVWGMGCYAMGSYFHHLMCLGISHLILLSPNSYFLDTTRQKRGEISLKWLFI